MLSLTYTQTALRVEQDRVRMHLDSLSQYLHNEFNAGSGERRENCENLLRRIKQVHLNCSWRRLESHVLPEIRESTRKADMLLAELESLRLLGLDLYRSARDQLRKAIDGKDADVREIRWIVSLYCRTLRDLLAKEESELLRMAWEFIPEETWFAIAQKFMHLDKEMLECEEMGDITRRNRDRLFISERAARDSRSEAQAARGLPPELRPIAQPQDDSGIQSRNDVVLPSGHGIINARGVYRNR